MNRKIQLNRLWHPQVIGLLSIILLLLSCNSGKEQWEPHVISVRYSKNQEVGHLDLNTTGPTLEINEGDKLEFLDFTLQMFPTQRSTSGMTIIRNKDVPPVPETVINHAIRISAIIRKWNNGSCYDKKDQLLTEWSPVQAEKWKIKPPKHSWIIGQSWDEIRIDIYIRQSSTNIESQHNINTIIFRTKNVSQFNRNIRRNIFSRMIDSIRGDWFCP